MPLPVLETPKYIFTVPSTKKRIEYRPFLVKEEKILMIAQETKDPDQIVKAIKDIITTCTFEKIDIDKCTNYDIEYLFLKLRAKSIGETATVGVACKECNKPNDVEINLENVNIIYPKVKPSPIIKITDSVGLTLKPLTLSDSERIGKLESSDDILNQSLISSIETIYDSSNTYSVPNDCSEEELITFIESLNHKQLEAIQEFISGQPALKHTVEFECIHCKHKNKIELEGIQSFF